MVFFYFASYFVGIYNFALLCCSNFSKNNLKFIFWKIKLQTGYYFQQTLMLFEINNPARNIIRNSIDKVLKFSSLFICSTNTDSLVSIFRQNYVKSVRDITGHRVRRAILGTDWRRWCPTTRPSGAFPTYCATAIWSLRSWPRTQTHLWTKRQTSGKER